MYRPAATVITTVVTPAASRDLTVSAVVADDWGVTDATVMGDGGFLDRTVTRCSRAAENFCNRIFAYETVQDDISLPHDGFPRTTSRRTFTLQLSRWPVAALTSVAVDGDDLVAGTDFLLDAETGQLTRLDTYGNPKDWTGIQTVVVYSAGYWTPAQQAESGAAPTGVDDLPDDIVDAVGRMVYTRYAERQRDPLIKSEQIDGVGRTDYLIPSSGGNLSPDVEDILRAYRVPVVV